MNVNVKRRENLDFLVACYGTQTDLAKVIVKSGVTQPIISSILRKKRVLEAYEARNIETELGIPRAWMDRFDLRQAWKHIRKFRVLGAETKTLFNEMLEFSEEHNVAV